MENASDAIIRAGAMLIFVSALTVAVTTFSQARATIDMVAYVSDETNYYEYMDTTNNTAKYRTVGLETIIPTLYKYYKENYTVVFLDRNGKGIKLYETQTDLQLWPKESDSTTIPPIASKYPGMDEKSICSFDLGEETQRMEPWTADAADVKENLDAFLNGGTFEGYNYSPGFIAEYADDTFRETIGEYSTDTDEDSENLSSLLDQGIRNNKNKRVIVYQLIN